jgi:hypothetical protein
MKTGVTLLSIQACFISVIFSKNKTEVEDYRANSHSTLHADWGACPYKALSVLDQVTTWTIIMADSDNMETQKRRGLWTDYTGSFLQQYLQGSATPHTATHLPQGSKREEKLMIICNLDGSIF